MAFDLALNIAKHDLLINGNDVLLIDNAERVAQQIQISLKFWFSEWFLDETQGVPYEEYILVKNPNMAHVRQILSEAIQQVEGVVKVASISLDLNTQTRELTVVYTANTDYGLVTRRELLGYGKQ